MLNRDDNQGSVKFSGCLPKQERRRRRRRLGRKGRRERSSPDLTSTQRWDLLWWCLVYAPTNDWYKLRGGFIHNEGGEMILGCMSPKNWYYFRSCPQYNLLILPIILSPWFNYLSLTYDRKIPRRLLSKRRKSWSSHSLWRLRWKRRRWRSFDD